ncbi:hypothetical protein K469DRAFT_757496 [Zopfia rhizophila CBS 207.26]|uniref:F-box domain-containing protein n=1 Tax=Zopfia rhizophila CBS 207.26 TaxID=1314779 RepID=A0A6A6EWW5_9PEZI|nr:hypothetical protein K469DRAFT_757496 [Zopfia rhizophila CBS 207.26]
MIPPHRSRALAALRCRSHLYCNYWRASNHFTEYFIEESTNWVWSTLTRPAPVQLKDAADLRSITRLSILQSMPNELLDMIFKELIDEKEDLMALGSCSEYLWDLMVRKMHSQYIKSAAPLAGKKIVFQDTWSKDLSKSFEEGRLVESQLPKRWAMDRMCDARRFN